MRSFAQIYKDDLDLVGKKAAELAELSRLGIPIPDGFVITASFFEKFLKQTGIAQKISEVHKLNHPAISESIEKLFGPIKNQIMHTHIPENLVLELHRFYKRLTGLFKDQPLNLFSSSPSDHKSMVFKNVKGDANFILKIKEIWANHIDKPVAIIVQKNINSKKKGRIISELGLASAPTKELKEIVRKIQKHLYFPQEIDYAIEKGKIYITDIRPFTGKVEKSNKVISQNKKVKSLLIKGISINSGIATGPVKVFRENNIPITIEKWEIIIVSHLNKLMFERIKKARAIVINETLLNPYDLAFYRRNIKIPTIAGATNATNLLQNGNVITVNGSSGEIYSGGFI